MNRKLEMKIRKLGPTPLRILQKIIEVSPKCLSAKEIQKLIND